MVSLLSNAAPSLVNQHSAATTATLRRAVGVPDAAVAYALVVPAPSATNLAAAAALASSIRAPAGKLYVCCPSPWVRWSSSQSCGAVCVSAVVAIDVNQRMLGKPARW